MLRLVDSVPVRVLAITHQYTPNYTNCHLWAVIRYLGRNKNRSMAVLAAVSARKVASWNRTVA